MGVANLFGDITYEGGGRALSLRRRVRRSGLVLRRPGLAFFAMQTEPAGERCKATRCNLPSGFRVVPKKKEAKRHASLGNHSGDTGRCRRNRNRQFKLSSGSRSAPGPALQLERRPVVSAGLDRRGRYVQAAPSQSLGLVPRASIARGLLVANLRHR